MNLVAIQDGAQDTAGLLFFLVFLIECRQGLGRLGWLELPALRAVPLKADNAGFDIATFFQGGGSSVRAARDKNASPLAHHLECLGMKLAVARAVHHLQEDWMNLAATVKGPVGACRTLNRAVSM